MVALLVFIIATWRKNCWTQKVHLAITITLSKIRIADYNCTGNSNLIIFPCRTNIRNSKQWVKLSVCLAKDFNNSFFLSHIYSLFSYILFHFLSLILCGIHSSSSTLNHSHGVPYILRSPVVHKFPASM